MATRRDPERERWYGPGLLFGCQRCGACCRGEPGYVWFTRAEAAEMAALLEMEPEAFYREYARRVGIRYTLRERADGDCVLLGPAGCRVYPVRPRQCRTFPFWPENLESAAAWTETGRECPGVDRGRRYRPAEIHRILAGDGT